MSMRNLPHEKILPKGKEREIVEQRKFKAGYIVRWEYVLTHFENAPKGHAFLMKNAYTPDGDYIGDPKTAYYLCQKRGIRPEKISPKHNICSIGWCEKEKKWYGWSHRAIYGFTIGSKVKPGDCAYVPQNRRAFVAEARRFYEGEVVREGKTFVEIKAKSGTIIKIKIPKKFGRGTWTAKTYEDAKRMAIDFAKGVA